MEKNKYHLLVLFIISILSFNLILIMNCIPDLADIDPPVVTIVHPSDGTEVNGTIPIVASATDDDKIKEIRIFVDGIVMATTGENFVSYSWDTNPYADNLEHFISAVALDESDNIGSSPIVAVNVIRGQNHDNTDPEVEILNPVEGQIVMGDVNIVAEASDDNQVEKVEFYIDGLFVDSVLSRPFDYLWKTTRNDTGDHTIFARAYDTNANTAASATITVTVDTTLDDTPPDVTIINPTDGQTVSGDVNVVADATDNNRVSRVEFYIDGILDTTLLTFPYSYVWNTAQVNSGIHNMFARAYDPNNNTDISPTITVTVDTTIDNTPPVVNILNPLNGQIISGLVNIIAEATDDTEVDRVEFYIDGFLEQTVSTPPYDYLWDTNLVNAGDHNIYAKAFDLSNNSATSPVITVTVDTTIDNTPPVVNIINPLNGQIVSGTVNIVAEATDNVLVDKVEFYIDGLLESTVTNPPFDYSWNTTSVDSGIHTIFARAYDPSNNSSVSPTINVIVNQTALLMGTPNPKVKIINPTRNGLMLSKTETKSIPIEVEIPKNIRIQKVEFYIDGDLHKVVTIGINNHFKYDWKLENFGDGLLHTIFVKVYNNSSNTAADMTLIRVYP